MAETIQERSSLRAAWRALRNFFTRADGTLNRRRVALPALASLAVATAVAVPVAASATGTLTLSCSVAVNSGKATVTWNNIGQSSNQIWDHGVLKTVSGRTYADTNVETSYVVVVYVGGVKYKATCAPGGGVTTTTSGGGGGTTTTTAGGGGGTLACRVSVASGVATVTWNNIGQSSNQIWDHGVLKTVSGRTYTDTTVETSYVVVVYVGGVKYKATCAPGGGVTTTTAGGGGTTTTARPTTTTTTPGGGTTTTARVTTTTTAPAAAMTCTVTAGATAGTVTVTWTIGAWGGSTVKETPSGAITPITGKSFTDTTPGDFYDLTVINNGRAYSAHCVNPIKWNIHKCVLVVNRATPGNMALQVTELFAYNLADYYEVYDRNGVLIFNTKTMYNSNTRPGGLVDNFYQPWNQAQFSLFSKIYSVIGVRNGHRSELKYCTPTETPIGLDLNGDGKVAKTVANVTFDLNADGTAEHLTEWFSPADGILVDMTKRGAFNGTNLFGDEGGKYADGYAKLALRDRNNDGALTGRELAGLGIWADDGDARVERGEVRSIKSENITSISTRATNLQSTATRANGSKIVTADLEFEPGSV